MPRATRDRLGYELRRESVAIPVGRGYGGLIISMLDSSLTMLVFWGLAGLCGSWAAGFWVRRILASEGLLDRPNARSSHTVPTVRGGGLGIVVVAVIGIGAAWCVHPVSGSIGLLGALLGVAAISFWDDLRTLSWKIRFSVHSLAAIAVGLTLGRVGLGGLTAWQAVLGGGLILLFLTGYANAFNFMDGINGIAAGQALITGLGTLMIAILVGAPMSHPALTAAVVIVGSAAGFLPHNFPRARMFMGDVGSVTLGFALAAVAVWVAADFGWWLLLPLGLLHTNFILDTGITVVRRMLRGETFHQSHREHFYQRLVRAGWSHTRVTLTEMAFQGVILGLLALYVHVGAFVQWIVVVTVIMIWLGFFTWAEMCFRRFMVEQGRAPL